MNDFKKLKKDSYDAKMSFRERAINDKAKVKKSPNLKKKYKGVIPSLRLEIYAGSKAKLERMAQAIIGKDKLLSENFKYIGLVN